MRIKGESRGLLLVVMSGVLALLLLLASVFVVLAREVRATTRTSTEGARAKLLARTGVEYAVSRLLEDPQGDPDDPENDWRYRDEGHIPLEKAANPSYNADPYADSNHNGRYDLSDPFDDPDGNGRYDGWSGRTRGGYGDYSDRFVLHIENGNSGIYVNGGVLLSEDRNGNDVPDVRDTMVMQPVLEKPFPQVRDWMDDGPNGWLVRVLNHLERAVTGNDDPDLGKELIGQRSNGGYADMSQVKRVLGEKRFRLFRPYLSLRAWVDPKVIRPQPVNGRPWRWLDVDEAHREDGGREVQVSNSWEGNKSYKIAWKRDDLYAYRQLRLGSVEWEPRAPVDFRLAPAEVLAASLTGLSGTYLHVWESNLGFDSGFGFAGVPTASYPYPARDTTDSPWIRTRVDYGSPYGEEGYPAYGPRESERPEGQQGGMLPFPGPLGRLKEVKPVSARQASAIAEEAVNRRNADSGDLPDLTGSPNRLQNRSDLRRFFNSLPVWEDVNEDGVLEEGQPYLTPNGLRRKIIMEDWNRNGFLDLEYFNSSETVRGLTPQQKDVLAAMTNPNTDLNDFNPDSNLWKWVDKTDLLGYTTEWLLERSGVFEIGSTGQMWDRSRTGEVPEGMFRNGSLIASKRIFAVVRLFEIRTDTTQFDFQGGRVEGDAPYPMVSGSALQRYPEPDDAALLSRVDYDGQIALGGIGVPSSAPKVEFQTDMSGREGEAETVSDLRGPFFQPLVPSVASEFDMESGSIPGGWFPDGAYSEKDGALKFPISVLRNSGSFYVSFWFKPNWFPEAATRPHALMSFSDIGTGFPSGNFSQDVTEGRWPEPIPVRTAFNPRGCYFVPARNNPRRVEVYGHAPFSARGMGWPGRSLLWGRMHTFWETASLNEYGFDAPEAAHSEIRLGRGEWTHVSLMPLTQESGMPGIPTVWINGVLSLPGGGWSNSGVGPVFEKHADGSANHLRMGEISGAPNMNYGADATYGPLVVGETEKTLPPGVGTGGVGGIQIGSIVNFMTGSGERSILFVQEQARLGRYYKEEEAVYRSSSLLQGARKVVYFSWAEIPVREDLVAEHDPSVSIRMEIWTDGGTKDPSDDKPLLVQDADGSPRRISTPQRGGFLKPRGGVYYRTIFLNEWDEIRRLNTPLRSTPFLDDVVIGYVPRQGIHWLDYREKRSE